MTVYDFCKFFDFTCEKRGDCFVATDDQGVFHDREFYPASSASDCFDSMLIDYIEEPTEEYGFVYDETAVGTWYEQAEKWCDNNPDFPDYYADMIRVLANPDLITEEVA